jgi:acyl carrier protein
MTCDIDDNVMQRLANIISQIFDVAHENIRPSTTAADVAGWDSLSHTSIIMVVEQAFNVSFDMEEIFGMNSVGEMAALIGEKQAQE